MGVGRTGARSSVGARQRRQRREANEREQRGAGMIIQGGGAVGD